MAQIDEDIIRLIIKAEHVVLVGSVSADGIPNISPRYVLGILNNEKLLFADAFTNKTFHNINAWPRVTVAIFDRDTQGGYQLKGSAEEVSDRRLITQAETRLNEFGIHEKPKKVWALAIKEIFSLEPSSRSRYPSSYYR
ncbi:MAG TPA: pyridoxamine 5'-phosphate oxidase family protein [Nitrososphaera sp.]|nr:pyridoxamine 5'-phosphate oxidase family protein [Nitrososphaera sp.]